MSCNVAINQSTPEFFDTSTEMYRIWINGCDDSTIFDMELTKSDLEVVKRIVDLSHEFSTYCCMPTLTVERI